MAKKNDWDDWDNWDIWDIWNIYGYLWPTNMSTSVFFFRMAWGLVLLEVYLAMHPKGTPSKTQQILK